MPHADGWAPQLHRLLPGDSKAPHQQNKARQRSQCVQALPGLGTDARNASAAPIVGQHARGMNAQKKNQTRH